MTQLMMDGDEELGGDVDAHLYPQVFHEVDVPGTGVAHYVSVLRFGEQATLPNRARKRREAKRREKALAIFDHVDGLSVAARQTLRQIVAGIGRGRRDLLIDVGPILGPDVAHKMRGDGSVGGDGVA